MKVCLKIDNLDKFIETDHQAKYVLRLKNQVISIVPIKKTRLFERVQAWFGYGPLSLKNISSFIQNNYTSVHLSLGRDVQPFSEKLIHKIQVYNQSHKTNPVSQSVINVLKIHTENPLVQFACAQKDQTYLSDEGNADFAYVNQKMGFGFVVDGSGHNNALMARTIDQLFNEFVDDYETKLAKEGLFFSSYADQRALHRWKKVLNHQLSHLEKKISENTIDLTDGRSMANDNSFHPAFSFAQVVKLSSGMRYLLSAQAADTCLLILKADGNYDTSLLANNTGNSGIGYCLGENPLNKHVTLVQTALDEGDTIVGFSDGIGDFVKMTDFKKILEENPPNFMQRLKNHILEEGADYTEEERNVKLPEGELTVSGRKYLKYHSYDKASLHDDISLFVLKI